MSQNPEQISIPEQFTDEQLEIIKQKYLTDLERRSNEGEYIAAVRYKLGEDTYWQDGTYMYDEFGRLLFTVKNGRVVSCSYPIRLGEYSEDTWESILQQTTVDR